MTSRLQPGVVDKKYVPISSAAIIFVQRRCSLRRRLNVHFECVNLADGQQKHVHKNNRILRAVFRRLHMSDASARPQRHVSGSQTYPQASALYSHRLL